MNQHATFHANKIASVGNTFGEIIGILRSFTPAKIPASIENHANAVQKPWTLNAVDQVGSKLLNKYGAVISHSFVD